MPLAAGGLDVESPPRDGHGVAVGRGVEAGALPAPRSQAILARTVGAELDGTPRRVDTDRDPGGARDTHSQRAAFDPQRHDALGRTQREVDRARARPAAEAGQPGRREVEITADGAGAADHLPRDRIGEPGVDVEPPRAHEPVDPLAYAQGPGRPVEAHLGRRGSVLDVYPVELVVKWGGMHLEP